MDGIKGIVYNCYKGSMSIIRKVMMLFQQRLAYDSMWCLTSNTWINKQVDVGVQTDQPKLDSKAIQTEFADFQENEDIASEREKEFEFEEEYEW